MIKTDSVSRASFLSFKYRLFFSLNCYGLNIELEKALAHLVDIDMDVVF